MHKRKDHMTTKINRTPFRPFIPPALLALDIHWETPDSKGRKTTITSDGKRFSYAGSDGKQGSWWVTQGVEFRPLNRTWEEVEALAAPKPEPKPESKAEEPFRPGMPPARLRAVCSEWDWTNGFGERRVTDFNSNGDHRFLTKDSKGTRKSPEGMSTSVWYPVSVNDLFHPHGKTWAEVERLADEKEAAAKAKLPKDGDPITVANALSVVKEGCKQAIAEDRKEAGKTVGTYSASGTTFTFPCATVEITYRAAPTHKTYIVAVPRGRRKYVKLYLQARGYRNVDALPYNTTDAPFYVGYVTKQVRDDLCALAPDILLVVSW